MLQSLPQQQYHQATIDLGTWRALSLYAVAANSHSPRSSSSPSPSLGLRTVFFGSRTAITYPFCLPAKHTTLPATASPAHDSFEEMVRPVALRCGGVSCASGCFSGGAAPCYRLCCVPSPLPLCSLFWFDCPGSDTALTPGILTKNSAGGKQNRLPSTSLLCCETSVSL